MRRWSIKIHTPRLDVDVLGASKGISGLDFKLLKWTSDHGYTCIEPIDAILPIQEVYF